MSSAILAAGNAAARQVGGPSPVPAPSEFEQLIHRLTELVVDSGQIAGSLNSIVARAGAPYPEPAPSGRLADDRPEAPGVLQRLHALLDRMEIAQGAQRREVRALDALI